MKHTRNKLLVGFVFVFSLFWLGLAGPLIFSTRIIAPQKVPQATETAKPKVEKRVEFLVFGDSGTGSNEQKKLAQLMGKENFDFILHTGDLAYSNGTQQEIQTRVLDIYKNLFAKASFYPSLGNHDIQTSNGAPYLSTWDLPKVSLNKNEAERYYSFDRENAHFVSLDSNLAISLVDQNSNTDMLDWLRADLTKAKDKKWIVVYFHHPPFSTGSKHGSNREIRDKLVPIFDQFKVDLVLTGHEHNYQRTCAINLTLNGEKCAAFGTIYFVTGGGGAGLYEIGAPKWYTAKQGSVYHFLKISLADCKLNLEVRDLENRIFDELKMEKCS